MVSLFAALESIGIVILGVSAAYGSYLLSHRWRSEKVHMDPEILRDRLRAYREIMSAMIVLNRKAVDIGEMQFQEEADLMAYGEESKLTEEYNDVAEAYQSNYHIISPNVEQKVDEYVDYLATYHDEGAHAGRLLSLSGSVAEAMRRDLNLESIFPEEEAPKDETTDDGVLGMDQLETSE